MTWGAAFTIVVLAILLTEVGYRMLDEEYGEDDGPLSLILVAACTPLAIITMGVLIDFIF